MDSCQSYDSFSLYETKVDEALELKLTYLCANDTEVSVYALLHIGLARSHKTQSTSQHLQDRRMQIMEHTAVNGRVHTGCKQHQRVCTQICAQICFRVLCEWGRRTFKTCSTSNVVSEMLRKLDIWPQMLIHSRAPLHWGFDFDPCLVHVQNERSSCRANKRNLLYRWVPLNPNMLNLNSS